MSAFADLIRNSGYSDEELAVEFQMKFDTVHRWRTGSQRPWPAMRHIVAEWLAEHPKVSAP